MKYAVIITEEADNREITEYVERFVDQDALKHWIRNNTQRKFTVIEYQELQHKIETSISFKKPGATRLS